MLDLWLSAIGSYSNLSVVHRTEDPIPGSNLHHCSVLLFSQECDAPATNGHTRAVPAVTDIDLDECSDKNTKIGFLSRYTFHCRTILIRSIGLHRSSLAGRRRTASPS